MTLRTLALGVAGAALLSLPAVAQTMSTSTTTKTDASASTTTSTPAKPMHHARKPMAKTHSMKMAKASKAMSDAEPTNGPIPYSQLAGGKSGGSMSGGSMTPTAGDSTMSGGGSMPQPAPTAPNTPAPHA